MLQFFKTCMIGIAGLLAFLVLMGGVGVVICHFHHGGEDTVSPIVTHWLMSFGLSLPIASALTSWGEFAAVGIYYSGYVLMFALYSGLIICIILFALYAIGSLCRTLARALFNTKGDCEGARERRPCVW